MLGFAPSMLAAGPALPSAYQPPAWKSRSRARVIAPLDMPRPSNGGPNVYRVKEDTCVGCNMCSLVCPSPGCITMVKTETGKDFETWEQRIERTGSSTAAWTESQGAGH